MGNWRTVWITGTCAAEHLEALQRAARPCPDWSNFGPLTITEGLCGLGDWPALAINGVGNLAERDYTPQAVADHLNQLLDIVPSLTVTVHCGADGESLDCIATVKLLGGKYAVFPPGCATLPAIDEAKILGRFMMCRAGHGGR